MSLGSHGGGNDFLSRRWTLYFMEMKQQLQWKKFIFSMKNTHKAIKMLIEIID